MRLLPLIRNAKHWLSAKAGGEEYEETYDKLLLSPGATPVKPPLEGIHSEGIFTLRNVEDTDLIKSYIADNQVKRAVVVGSRIYRA